MAWTTPKTNWNATDYYNFGDLNRVESNTSELLTLIAQICTAPTLATAVTNRTNASIDYYDSINRIENNIKLLKDASQTPLNWQTPKINWVSGDSFAYTDANRLEVNQLAIKTMIDNIVASFKICGTFNAGQDFAL